MGFHGLCGYQEAVAECGEERLRRELGLAERAVTAVAERALEAKRCYDEVQMWCGTALRRSLTWKRRGLLLGALSSA